MIGFFTVVVSLYVFSIRNSVAHSLSESAADTIGLPGEFHLPGLKESVMANVKDIVEGMKGSAGSIMFECRTTTLHSFFYLNGSAALQYYL